MANEATIDMVAAKPSEVIIVKIQTSNTNFDLPTPAPVEANDSVVSANVDAGVTNL